MRWGKLLIAGISASTASVLGWLVLGSSSSHPQPGRTVAAADRGVRAFDEAFVREYWGEQAGFQYDPVAHLVRRPRVHENWTWKEYPGEKFVIDTNEQGFREDQPTLRDFAGTRILVAGDSHTDGVVENRSSFANLAEGRLRAALGQELEIVNAGVGYTGPSCYLGMLEKCLGLEPDVFVTALYAGNDFTDELALTQALGTRTASILPADYIQKLEAVLADFRGLYQGLNQLYHFAVVPEDVDQSVALVLESVLAMDALCRAEDIGFLLVLLPTKVDVEDDDRERWLGACERLGLDESAAGINLELGQRVLAAARERGIECLDPTEAMRRADGLLYWKEDHHLALDGHALLGALLAERLEEILARRAARDLR